MNNRPLITEVFADNGSFSHYNLIDSKTGDVLYSQDKEEQTTRLAKFLKVQDAKQDELNLRISFMRDHKFSLEEKSLFDIYQAKEKILRDLRLQVQEGVIDVR